MTEPKSMFPLKIPSIRVPDSIARPELPRFIDPAEAAYELLVERIREFEANLSSEEEVGGRFIAAPKDGVMHICGIYHQGHFLIFKGFDPDGRPTELVQHHTQLSVQLCALPKQEKQARRIGF